METLPPLAEPVTSGAASASAAVAHITRDDTSTLGATSRRSIASLNFHWSQWAFLAWLVGFVFVLGRLVIAHAGAHMLVIRGAEVIEEDWQRLAKDSARQMGVRQGVQLRWSAWTRVPLSIGVWSSTIVLPEAARMWGLRQRQSVLFHELAHIKRRDCLIQLLTQITCAIHWVNPLVWIAARNARFEREYAADDMVLLAGVQASTYAEILLEIAHSLRSARVSTVAALAMAKHSRMKSRVSAVLRAPSNRRSLNLTGAVVVVATVACIVLPLAILHPVQANVEPTTSNVASDTLRTITDAHLSGIRESNSESDLDSRVWPSSDFNSGTAAESNIAGSNESVRPVDLILDVAAIDTLTAEQRRVLYRRFGIDSTFVHEVKKLGFMDMTFDDYIAFGENGISPDYIRGMQAAGLKDLSKRDLVSLAANGIDPAFAKSQQETGYADLTTRDYLALAINGIDPDYIRGMQAAGLTGLTRRELIALGANDIDPDYILGMQATGYADLTIADYISLTINGIDPNYIRGMQAAGLTGLTRRELIALGANDIDPDYILGMQETGYADLTTRDYLALAINGIDPDYIRGMQAAGLTGLTRRELIALGANDIDPDYILGMQATGYADLTIADYISLTSNGIDPNYIRGMQAAGLTGLTRRELIALGANDIDPDYILGMQATGYADLTIADYISLAINGIDPNYIRGMQAAGLTGLTRSELITMATHDIDPDYIRGLRAAVNRDLTVAELVALARKSARQE